MKLAALLLLLSGSLAPAAAQGPPGGGAGGPSGMLGVAVVVPPDAEEVRLVAEAAESGSPVVFTDDGTFSVDLPRDREWWAFLMPPPKPDGFTLRVAGTVSGQEVFHEEEIRVPSAWMAGTYPVTFIAVQETLGWRLDRVLSGALPERKPGSTGAGISGLAQQSGLSALSVYMAWGGFLVFFCFAAILRSSVLRARSELASDRHV